MSSDTIIVVSGLPRSGTSLMMQMLAAGGVEILSDKNRAVNDHNPNGYHEDIRVKRLDRENSWVGEAKGKAVKVVSPLLQFLPGQWNYKVIFMKRDLSEVLQSQQKMLNSDGISSNQQSLVHKYNAHLQQISNWMDLQSNMSHMFICYSEIFSDIESVVKSLRAFLDFDLNLESLQTVVDPSLYRNRK